MQPNSQLVFVTFVGGPFHGKGMLMANPEITMFLGEADEQACYRRRSVEMSQGPNGTDLVFYAPEEMSDGEFDALIADDSQHAWASPRADRE